MFNPLLFFALVGVALADVDVQVGQNGQLRFSPEIVHANIGENINFHFHGSIHTATESTARLNDPCHPLGGFDTGVQRDGSVQNIVVSTHNSIYVHCTPHCGQGMVMIVNPGPNDSIETFRQAAIRQEGGGGGGGGSTTSTTSTTSTSASSSSRPRTSSTTSTRPSASVSSVSTISVLPSSVSVPVSSGVSNSSVSGTSTIPPSFSITDSATTAGAAATTTGAAVVAAPAAFGSFTFFLSSLIALMF